MTREEARGLLMRCEAESYCPHYLQKFNCDGCKQRIALDMAIEALSAHERDLISRADAIAYSADAVQGEWIDREHCQVDEDAYEIATCSHCKAEITLEYPNDNYCPNCGARMKGGAE